jgi:hypothetical protein
LFLQPELPGIPDRPAAHSGAGASQLLLEPILRFARSPCCARQNRPTTARLALVKPRQAHVSPLRAARVTLLRSPRPSAQRPIPGPMLCRPRVTGSGF